MKFTYQSGQRPLDGYTVKRGIGRGGFGEVYYAVSDGGKEVALKLICNNLDVELRGVSQCLNFKHPNLVDLYDLRVDAHGDHWLVMEYVGGESLSAILNRHPHGLDPELAKQWFLGLAAAVGYLHEHGIVHRDIKPGNIFLENGSVKVGDYGLCKFISGSQRTAQTQSVGTVHYMAPEVSTGNYNKQIDIYAAAVVLYEMLTGHVPFEGESAGEILMKHLTTPPDLSKVPSVYVPVLSKALSKNPAHRHRTMSELAKEVAAIGEPEPVPAAPRPLPRARPAPEAAPLPAVVLPEARPVLSPRARVAELCGSMVLSVFLAVLFCILWAAVLRTNDLQTVGPYFFLTVACCWAVLVPSKLWLNRVQDSMVRRVLLMCLGLGIGLGALWLDGYELPALLSAEARAAGDDLPPPQPSFGPPVRLFRSGAEFPVAAAYLSYFGLAFFLLRWWKLAERRRSQRFSVFPVVAAGLWGLVLLFLWPGAQELLGVGTLVMSSVIIQLVSPWEPPPAPGSRKLRLRYA